MATFIEDLQGDLPQMIQELRDIASCLECMESCDSKLDFCENLSIAILGVGEMKRDLNKLLKAAEECSRYSARKPSSN